MDVNKVCRICDKPSATRVNVFGTDADGKQILRLIRETLPIIIYRNDPLSKQICTECLETIRCIHTFRQNSIGIVGKQRRELENLGSKNALLYLTTLENTDENEMWMYSSPAKKEMGGPENLCTKCRSPVTQFEPRPRPFRKYREAIRKPQDLTTSTNLARSIPIKRLRKAAHIYESFPKRRRIIGPKCVSRPFVRTIAKEVTVYNPLNLLSYSLAAINTQNLSDFSYKPYVESKETVESETFICEYCMCEYSDIRELAMHEQYHMKIKVDRVDNLELWDPTINGAEYRNVWLRENDDRVSDWETSNIVDEPPKIVEIVDQTYEEDMPLLEEKRTVEDNEVDEEHQDLLMPLEETDDDSTSKFEIVLVDTKAMVRGVPLADIPKLDRRVYYNRSYNMGGVKRKFCPLCRYTFKDNWAIELHYFSSACYYTCRFCGIRFNKQRVQFDDHVEQHTSKGDIRTDKIFVARKKNDPVPKILSDTSKIIKEDFSEGLPTRGNYPKVKPLKMKQLFEKSNMNSTSMNNSYYEKNGPSNTTTTESTKQNQAYFCRKCFKVFFKLDEFDNHVNNCSAYPDTSNDNEMFEEEEEEHVESEEKYEPPKKYQKVLSPDNSRNGETYSSTGRPIRNCVKSITYKDHLDLDIEQDEEEERVLRNPDGSFKGIECGLCSAVFPTIPSRNSHMRIHKNGLIPKTYASPYSKAVQNSYHRQNNYHNNGPGYSQYESDIAIKQEPLEPLVEIHETNSSVHNIPSSIGSVSITPIPSKSQRMTSINPDIMKLVQGNPNITLKNMQQFHKEPSPPLYEQTTSLDDVGRSYKCSSCSKTYSNKSNLYFHKKNQCEGSRYPCPFCKKRFGTESAYSSHIFYSHPE